MRPVVHVLIPCSRRENLVRVLGSVFVAASAPAIDVLPLVLFDDAREHVGGWALRNQMLDGIVGGWIWMLDDDTVAHPEILARFAAALEASPEMLMFLVAQSRPNGWDPGCADPARLGHGEQLPVGGCAFDTGQAIIRRDVIGDYRFDPEVRGADGELWDDVLAHVPHDRIVWTEDVLAYYNELRS